MKKFLILLAICLSNFFFFDNTKAEPVDTHVLDYISMTNTYGLSDSEVRELMKSVGKKTETIDNYILLRNYAIDNTNDGNHYYLDENNSRMFVNLTGNFLQGGIDIEKTSLSNTTLGYFMTVFLHIQVSSKDKPYYYVNNGTVKKKSTASWITNSRCGSAFNDSSNNSDLEDKSYFFYETDQNISFEYKHFLSRNYNGDIIVNNKTYSLGDYLDDTTLTGINSLINELKLNYKNGFTTNDQVDKLGKVTVNFKESDSTISSFHKLLLKLQYGSNDWTKENIPVFSHYRIYGQLNEGSIWKQLDESDLNYMYDSEEDDDGNITNNYINMEPIVTDTTFDYVEGSLADSSVSFEMNFPETINTEYTNWKIEFYFDNTSNGYIYVYDSLKESTWEESTKMFDNYLYYYFPSKYKYAFISSSNENNKDRIYFPYNSTINGLVQIQGQYLNRNDKNFSLPLENKKYKEDDYYSYFDFNFKSSEKILAINRVLGGLEYTNYYNANLLDLIKEGTLKTLGIGSYLDKVKIKEDTYFYVPIGYEVEFTSDIGSISIITSDGYFNYDVGDTKNDYEVEKRDDSSNDDMSFDESLSSIFKKFDKNNIIFSYFKKLYTNLKMSKIGSYISIVLIGSILILVIKSMSK